MPEIYRDGHVHVRKDPCDRCLLSAKPLVDAQRRRDLINSTRDGEGGSFICHRSQGSNDPEAICRRWWDSFADENFLLRLAKAAEIVRYV